MSFSLSFLHSFLPISPPLFLFSPTGFFYDLLPRSWHVYSGLKDEWNYKKSPGFFFFLFFGFGQGRKKNGKKREGRTREKIRNNFFFRGEYHKIGVKYLILNLPNDFDGDNFREVLIYKLILSRFTSDGRFCRNNTNFSSATKTKFWWR